MAKVRNMYIGGNQIKQPYLGSNPLKAVYLGSTMVWGDGNAKVWVLDRTSLSTTNINVSGINGSSTHTAFTHTSISTFTNDNANTYEYEELTSNKTPGTITLWPALQNSYGFLNCYICEFDGSDLSFPPSSYLAKIQLNNGMIINPTSWTDLGTSKYYSSSNNTTLQYLGEKDYVFDIEAPDVRFGIRKIRLYNRYNFTNPPELTSLKLSVSPNLTVNTTYNFNTNTTVKEVTLSNSLSQGNYGIFNIYTKLRINPVGQTLGGMNNKCGICLYLVNSSGQSVSNGIYYNFYTTDQTGYKDIEIGTTELLAPKNTVKGCRLNTETKNEELYLVILVSVSWLDDVNQNL